MFELVDTHCHLDFEKYHEDREDVLARAAAAGVTRIINPAIDVPSGEAVLALARRYSPVYAAVGIHPNSTAGYDQGMLEQVEGQAGAPKVVAIGEIGLDYYREWSPPAQQRLAFEQQLALAARLKLPVIIHNREASEDVLAILENWVGTLPDAQRGRPGVLHSFSAPPHVAEQALALGFYLGFTGPLTFKNADELRRIAAAAPADRLVIETDGPFLAPHPHRGARNEPAHVRFVAEQLARLHHVSLEEMAALTTGNAERLFQLPQTLASSGSSQAM